jgi:cobalt-zinc-cadmium efflux system protein
MSGNQKSLIAALFITVVIFLVELVGGFIANSLALQSDAGHMLTDAMALVMALLATTLAARPANKKQTYGFYRLEILSSLFNGSVLVLIAAYIFFQAYGRFFHPTPVWSGLMLTVATIGLLANIGAAVILARGSRENLNLRGAFMHVLSDLASSVGVIIGGLVIQVTRWTYIDPIISVLIAVLILRGALSLVYESVSILIESTPQGIDLEEVVRDICQLDGVEDIHDLHIWAITSGINSISAHIVIEDKAIDRTGEILKNINQALKGKYNISHSTFQTECESCPGEVICHIEPVEKEHEHKH